MSGLMTSDIPLAIAIIGFAWVLTVIILVLWVTINSSLLLYGYLKGYPRIHTFRERLSQKFIQLYSIELVILICVFLYGVLNITWAYVLAFAFVGLVYFKAIEINKEAVYNLNCKKSDNFKPNINHTKTGVSADDS